MRSIQKGAPPQEYVNWLSQTASIRKESALWDIPTDIKNAIKSAMLIEQGYLCAYTMRRIEVVNECHIEHIEARNTNASQNYQPTGRPP